MQPGEDARDYLRRVFRDCLCDLSPKSFDRVPQMFHPTYRQHVDGDVLDRDAFMRLMSAQKSRLAMPPTFTWLKLVATEPQNGRIHVTSVHTVQARLKNGAIINQRVLALVEIDVASGTIIHCEELTRMESEPKPVSPTIGPRTTDRPVAAAPLAKIPRSASSSARERPEPRSASSSARERPEVEPMAADGGRVLEGVKLRRTGVSDLLSDMCREFEAPEAAETMMQAMPVEVSRSQSAQPESDSEV